MCYYGRMSVKEGNFDCYDVTDAETWCEHAAAETELIPRRSNAINPPCVWGGTDYREFEKSVKSYELSDGFLTIGRRKIDTDAIDYLEIDGRVVINEGGEEDADTNDNISRV